MKRKWSIVTLVCLLLAVTMAGGIAWRLTRGNAGWQIRQVFPGAEPYSAILDNPEFSIPEVIRKVFPSYFRADEWLGMALNDSPEALDLEERFSRLRHLHIRTVALLRCRVTRLGPTSEDGFPGVITFIACDLSALPEEQRARLEPFASDDPATATIFKLGHL